MIKLLLPILLSSLCYAGSFTPIEDKANLSIVTPSLAERKTSKLRLENGLEAYLISDPGTTESGACVAVEVGSFDDPQDRPGMAHFCEHMLFMGTTKFPNEEEYHSYLNEHGGKHNAFTKSDRTVFMFSIHNEGFEGGFDRFAQFFISPLFSASCIQRECHAVDEEFAKNVTSDGWRSYHVKKELANPAHPFHRFCIGNKSTLGDVTPSELKTWYEAHYSANLMHLVVYSPLPLETLEKMVVEAFSPVPTKENLTPSTFAASLFTKERGGTLVTIAPHQEIQTLDLMWELPRSFSKDTEVKADELLCFVLGHEGETSLLAALKKEHLAESLEVESMRMNADQSLFILSVSLSSKGVSQYEKVIAKTFEALASFSKSGIPSYIFDEIQEKKKIDYSYQQRDELFSLVTELGNLLPDEPLETFPLLTLMPTKYDEQKIAELLSVLTPQRCLFTLTASPTLSKVKMDKKENWMDVEYAVSSIPKEKLASWSSAAPSKVVEIPPPNPFMPANLKIVKENPVKTGLLPTTHLIGNQAAGKVYYAADDRFEVPEVSLCFSIKTPCIRDDDAASHVMADLYCHAIDERLSSLAYQAKLGGLNYNLKPIHNGIELSLNGYSEKAGDFLLAILEEIKSFHPTKEEYDLYKDRAARSYHNKAISTPIAEAKELLWSIIYKDYVGPSVKENAITLISFEEFASFSDQVLKECYIEGMIFGNLTEESAIELWAKVQEKLPYVPYPIQRHPKVEVALLPDEQNPSYLVKKSKLPGNAVILAIESEPFSMQKRAALDILAKGLEEPFFSELRTKQQTAYLVRNVSEEIERHLYSFFLIQSSSHDARDLLSRFELFFESTLQNLKTSVLSEEKFLSYRGAMINSLQNVANSPEKMGDLLHTLAFNYDANFSWIKERIEGLETLTYAKFQEHAHEFLGKDNHRRLAVLVNGALPQVGRIAYRKVTSPTKIRKEICYKCREQAVASSD